MTTTPSNIPESPAEKFVDEQLAKTRASLRRTRAFCIVSIVFTIAYMSFLTYTLESRLLMPKAAAHVATSYLSKVVQEQGDALSQRVIAEVPAYVRGVPDTLVTELPRLRRDLQNRLDVALAGYARDIAAQWGTHLDEYMAGHRDELVALVEQAQDAGAAGRFGDMFEQEALRVLYTKGRDGQSAMDRLQQGAGALHAVELKLDRLANAPDLTSQEKTMRQLVAVSLQTGWR